MCGGGVGGVWWEEGNVRGAVPEKLIIDPIVEKAVRKSLKKPTGDLTKAVPILRKDT